MTFERKNTEEWHQEIPGTRWLKADLHIHTIDDIDGGRAKLPEGITKDLSGNNTLSCYARRFLQAAVKQQVQVIGLTPHSPVIGSDPEKSAVWTIVDEWNNGVDDDGVHFREKIYAVFPGFEPSFNEGKSGLHLLFLFDPEIGRNLYLKAFDLVMGGVSPWKGNNLEISNKHANEAFHELQQFRMREIPVAQNNMHYWDYLILAPHIESDKGLLDAKKSQVLKMLNLGEITGLEIGKNKIPAEILCKKREWLRVGMKKYRQAFFHGSDAYSLQEVGHRYTWIKLGSSRIEALRQAFVASDSRIRIGFERHANGDIQKISNPPSVEPNARPWLKNVKITGGASFFGGIQSEMPLETTFRLSPDLTCIIGGSMTGKSTFLDGLRVHIASDLPDAESIRKEVKDRGDLFSAGAPDIDLDIPGENPALPNNENWPAQFFAQNELQFLAKGEGTITDILSRLVPTEAGGIEKRNEKIQYLDNRLTQLTRELGEIYERLSEAEQSYKRAQNAKEALAAFSEVGVEQLHRTIQERQIWEDTDTAAASEILAALLSAGQSADELHIPDASRELCDLLINEKVALTGLDLREEWKRILNQIKNIIREVEDWSGKAKVVVKTLKKRESDLAVAVARALYERGISTKKLNEVRELNRHASLLPSFKAELDRTRRVQNDRENEFQHLRRERNSVIQQQRGAFDRIISRIESESNKEIRAHRIDNGDSKPLDRFISGLRQRGITRWWNDLVPSRKPSPEVLIKHFDAGNLEAVGMSETVQETFREILTKLKKRELTALRCPDVYKLELRVKDHSYRRLDKLSGGQRVSVLLSLLLETADDRPLVIDQPEDEIDNRFLFDTVLPALRRLKGRRQVIVATHNANIVVNGDADQVIVLEATAHRGRVVCAGAIDDPKIREAIVRTVDGGEEAFRLRRKKYGF